MVNAADAPRPSCPMCVSKHLGQAAVLFQEALQGYPTHRWLAIGHMAEAEAESQGMAPKFAERIRAERVKAEKDDYVPDCESLIGEFQGLGRMSERVASRFMMARGFDHDVQELVHDLYPQLQELEAKLEDMAGEFDSIRGIKRLLGEALDKAREAYLAVNQASMKADKMNDILKKELR